VDTLPEALPEGAARVLRGAVLAAVACFLALLIRLGWDYAQFAWMQRTPVLRLPMGLVYLAIPVGCAAMLLHLLLLAPRLVARPRGEAERLAAMEAGSL
jgi:TRAP-type C4-dicarboxylate transport system permease small subunit